MANSGLLNNDIYLDVLSRLPTKDLLRMKCVCKSWRQLISDPFFRRVHSSRRQPISGFFFLQKYHWFSDYIKTIAYIPVEREGAGFYQPVLNFLPEDVKVLASCNGLICGRSSFFSRDPALYVCNPLNKEWIRLNWTKPDIIDTIALAFDPCQDTEDSSTNFKLVRVQRFHPESEDPYFSFNIYSSDTDSWRISQEICHCRGKLSSNKVIFVQGILHWLTNFGEIVSFNVENEKSLVVPVPVPVPVPDSASESERLRASCIGESNGQLHYILVSDDGIYIWSLEDYIEFKWNLKYSRSIKVIGKEHPSLVHKLYFTWPMDPLAFRDGYLLMERSNIYLYNIEKNKLDEVFSVPFLRKTFSSALQYSMNLVTLNSA